jgi:hypothetical protein
MPSAEFSHAVKADCSALSQFRSHATSQGTWEISPGKTQNVSRVAAGFIKHTPLADGGLRGHVPARPGCTTPHIRFLLARPAVALRVGASPRTFGLGFLQTPPRGDALALLLAFGSACTWREDFHLARSVPCPARAITSTSCRRRQPFAADAHWPTSSCCRLNAVVSRVHLV